MGFQVVNGAMMVCPFGTGPGTLIVLPANRLMVSKLPAANINDYKPYVNIPGFIMCTSMANPVTASQTSAASGVLTPGACTPMTSAPWAPGCPKVMVAKMPALNNLSVCQCSYGGTISITFAAQVTTMIP